MGYCRNVQDSTVTIQNGRRDYLLTLDGILVVGGEDKTDARNFAQAVEDCRAKHKGANAAIYGGLQYIFLVATGGDQVGVYAMRLDEAHGAMTEVVQPFRVSKPHSCMTGRCSVKTQATTLWMIFCTFQQV
jgi:hypothetical protein